MSPRQKQAVELFQQLGNVTKVAEAMGVSRQTIQKHLGRAGMKPEKMIRGRMKPKERRKRARPKSGVHRYIFTSAQNNTHLHEGFWENLQAFAKHHDAEIHVGTFSYDISSYGEMSTKRGKARHDREVWFDDRLTEHFSDEDIQIAPGIVWCGSMNVMPTAINPLSGLEVHTGRQSGIFPHTRIAMQSVASAKDEPTKFNYTTGAVTQINYIQKKAGIMAERHHAYGALFVEVDSNGDWWARQINADLDGSFYDLDCFVKNGHVEEGHSVEAITWGDVHAILVDPEVNRMAWGDDGMLDTLRPKYQFLHDVLDFRGRNHHERGNPHKRFEHHITGIEEIEYEVAQTTDFVNAATRDFCKTIVVDSNHDNAMRRWLREGDYRSDPINALYFLRCQIRLYESIEAGDNSFHLLEWAMTQKGVDGEVRFLREDESFVICHDKDGGIECGMHGHLGPNGVRGSAQSLRRVGRRANIGHSHSACIVDGIYQAGTSSQLDLGYNVGPSSWSQSHIVTHRNGKRQIVTMWKGKWRA